MRLTVSWIVSLILTLVVPVYVGFIYDQLKSKRRGAIGHLILGLFVASVVFFLGWYGLTAPTGASARQIPGFELATKNWLDEEHKLRTKTPSASSNSQIVKIKFDEAAYAQAKDDFDRAITLYTEIERGSDENGSFVTFPSATVKNNMAIAYFRKQADKGFKASRLLFDALQIEPKPGYLRDAVQRNIDALDRYVNQ